MEVSIQRPQKKKKVEEVPVAVYRIIQVPPNIEGIEKTATIQIVPKNELESEGLGQHFMDNEKVNVTVRTSFVIEEDSNVKQHSTSKIIRVPIDGRGRQRKCLNDPSDVDGSGNESDRIFQCTTCEKTFKHSSHLKRHINTHTGERVYKCDLCEKKFLDASTLSRHRKIHSGDKPWACKICIKSFGTLGSLRRHITVHNQEGRPYQCGTCFKRFPDNSSYQKHTFIHTGIKPHVCDICGKAFVHIGDLNGHRKIHVDVKPYNCERCGKDFAKHSNYARHLLIHEGDKEFSCSICGVSYNFQSSLTRHILTHVRRETKFVPGTNSKDASSEENPDADLKDKDSLDEKGVAVPESSKKNVLVKVTRTRMKHVNKLKHLQKLKELKNKDKSNKAPPKIETPKGKFEPILSVCKTDEQQIIPDVVIPECDPDDPTVLPPQDEILCKKTTTEDVASLLSMSEDFGSTKDIPPPLMPPSLESPASTLYRSRSENEYILPTLDGHLSDPSTVPETDSIYAIISLEDNSVQHVVNVEPASDSANSGVVLAMLDPADGSEVLSNAIIPDNNVDTNDDSESIQAIKIFKKNDSSGLKKDEVVLLKKAAQLIFSTADQGPKIL